MPWKPSESGEVPTLGWYVLDWMTEYLARPAVEEYEPFAPYREQEDFILRWYEIDPVTGRYVYGRGLLGRPRGWGKALALDTVLPTPSGWTTMADIAVGDELFDEVGQTCRVVAKSPTWTDTDCWAVTFSDCQRIVCSGDHLWTVECVDDGTVKTITTRALAATQFRSERCDARYRLRTMASTGGLDLPSASLPIAPYVLGVWLGDGETACGRITIADDQIATEIANSGYTVEAQTSSQYRWLIRGLQPKLRTAGLLGNKHIPGVYLRASRGQRLALLQGLMDTDGHCDKAGHCEFTTTSTALRDGVADLLAGLGIKFGLINGRARLYGKDCGPRYRFKFTVRDDIPVFRLQRQLDRLRPATDARKLYATRRIKSVVRTVTVPTACIHVDSPNSLFLCGERMVQTHNSPILGALCIVEGLADVLFDGWDANGQPVGKPWRTVRTPLVHVAAVSEDQTNNTWQPMLEMLTGPVIDAYPGIEPFDTVVNLPRGKIEKRTSSGRTVKGAPTTFAVLDQTEEWVPSNGGPALAQKIRTNTSKNGGRTIESPNAYIPGEGSVAEKSAETAVAALEGRTLLDHPILWDHREAPPDTDMADRQSLTHGLRVSYGDSSGHPDGCVLHDPPCAPGHVDLQAQIAVIWDPATDVQTARSDYLNQITHASDSWISQPDWAARLELDAVLADGETVVLGFDGSRGRAKGKADATALIGCRVHDGLLFEIRVWEQPDGPAGRDWTPNPIEVDAAVRGAFDRWRVVGFYADPSGWGEHVARWEATYGRRLKIKATAAEPIAVWPRGKTSQVTVAVEAFREAVVNGEIRHHGSSALTRHVLNARRRATRTGYLIFKAYPQSPDKIDAAYAAVMAWKARLDALAAGVTQTKQRRIRKAVIG